MTASSFACSQTITVLSAQVCKILLTMHILQAFLHVRDCPDSFAQLVDACWMGISVQKGRDALVLFADSELRHSSIHGLTCNCQKDGRTGVSS